MDRFPNTIKPTHKDKFPKLLYNFNLSLMRMKIYHLVVKGDENQFFDLETFDTEHVKNMEITQQMWEQVSKELELMGWKTKLSYGDTGAFIYSSDKPPANCW